MKVTRKLVSLVAFLALLVTLVCVSVPVATSAAVPIVNGGFETGNFTGWTVNIPAGGDARVVTSFNGILPKEGSYFALLTNGQQDVYTMASQSFTVDSPGTMIDGWAFFGTLDYLPWNDDSKVEITLTSGGQVIATLFQSNVAALNNQQGNFSATPWTYFLYTFTAPGQYTIQGGVVNRIDSNVHSYIGLDGINTFASMQPQQLQLRRPSSLPSSPNTNPIVVQNLNVNPTQAYAGQPITITANMANDGDVISGYTASLKINGTLEKTKLGTVDGHSAVPVDFTVTRSQPGTYTVDIGGQKGSFIVLADKASSGPPVNGAIIAMIIVAALIVGVVVVLTLTFRRTT
jgi:hypothetical protein